MKLPSRPWHVVNIWWDFAKPAEHFESLSVSVTFDREVPATHNLCVSQYGIAEISGMHFYGGLQTNINGWVSAEDQ